MWSASMFVTTASTGARYKNDASDSSASTTMNSPLPNFACEPAASSRPPITKVGSMSASASTLATRLVVVVLPCVPATAMPCFKRINSASIIARGTTGILWARAATTSGLSSLTALETTTASAAAMFAEAWQAPCHRVAVDVRPADFEAQIDQHFSDAAHSRAAYADEMHAFNFVFH